MATTKALIKALTDVVLDNSVQFPKQQISVTVTTSGQKITAPADGYCQAIATSEHIEVANSSTDISSSADSTSGWARCHTPVKKGDVIYIWFTGILKGVYWMENTIRGGVNSFINSVVASLSGVHYGLA